MGILQDSIDAKNAWKLLPKGKKKKITAKQRAARRANMAVARKARKKARRGAKRKIQGMRNKLGRAAYS